ncbi:MAG: hypothetical protein A3D67_01805 [Candidatus Lloydbacteria bacterium RIFCSPHIGHO2_02_FULL_51_22]|uniref:RNA helicase n=3 Tax=Candidatus Lloydiibacteriota TaxID=1817910 RepID=A0A1G2DAR5_9BACT|nr:MAG: hypothetical protein A3D67_01805 [Candidatus Lloydbacteria bacterium RIFCSPHIGHO2_02_FULL_51_22]OGZ14525.1 MAG: hypothetical protein A3J08_02345 [Candidatus Lloydbacteria bacterium RIFCSPLOWO2_02_FULL_51_11]OGZ16474.1 MAG: hypothetical protein A3G11_02805 [Candidatus Lloydbacteria bacterium RIFCSPLOWO2_12_FULL_51_9]
MPKHAFKDFKIAGPLLANIMKAGLSAPTPIQDEIIPHILLKRDVIGLANTGTGKTAAFLIPLIHLTLRENHRRTLILTPTRELALQIEQELKKLSAGMRMYSTVCVGGADIRPQIRSLSRPNHFVIGTPGRTLDLINRGVFKPAGVTTVVLDEADRMLDMGFIHDIRKILSGVPSMRETLFFSATMSREIESLIATFAKNPATVSVKKKDTTDNIAQDVVRCEGKDKFVVLTDLLRQSGYTRVLVFGAMKHGVERLRKRLDAEGIAAESIHGNKSHSQRQRALARFKTQEVRVLVATDVAARGLHIDHVSHVINYDLPQTYEDYIHRIGRTGRGKERGKALSFVE